MGDHQRQTVPEPDARHCKGNRNRCPSAGKRLIPRLLSGNDLRGLSGRIQSGQRRSSDSAVLDDEILQASAEEQRQAFWGSLVRRHHEFDRPKTNALRLDPMSYENLRQQVVRRDGWRCRSCGAMSNREAPPQTLSQPFSGRLRGKLDHTSCAMPRRHPSLKNCAWLSTAGK